MKIATITSSDRIRWRVFRLFATIFVYTQCLYFISTIPFTSAVFVGVSVKTFIDDITLERCRTNLLASDANGDEKLNFDEYVTFLSQQSEGSVDVPDFQSVPLRLLMIYHWTACLCSYDGDTDCCVGDASHIRIDDDGSSERQAYITVFCAQTNSGIDDVLSTTSPSLPPFASEAPTAGPTNFVSPSPSLLSSSAPSTATTSPPSQTPSSMPSRPPSTPTLAPTGEDLLCVGFQYGLNNQGNFTASQIFNEEGNTIKRGLINATTTIVIRILNETFPSGVPVAPQRDNPFHYSFSYKVDSEALQFLRHKHSKRGSDRRLSRSQEAAERSALRTIGILDRGRLHALMDEMYSESKYLAASERAEDSSRSELSKSHTSRGRRRLVYFTSDIPVTINRIVPNPVCPSNNTMTQCAIVSSTVCVVLGPEDDPEEVQDAIVQGLSESFANGDFVDAIPPEHSIFL